MSTEKVIYSKRKHIHTQKYECYDQLQIRINSKGRWNYSYVGVIGKIKPCVSKTIHELYECVMLIN